MKRRYLIQLALLMAVVPFGRAWAEIPTLLTDRVHKGSGTIDLMVDVSSEELSSYLDSGTLYLGVDLNEAAVGNENRSSVGIAIDQMELVITTTSGEVAFGEFYTNTTAMIQESGNTESGEYYTMFGTLGSSQLTGGSSSFDISTFDDVVEVRNIEIEGEILSAELRVTFLDTNGTGDNETFFDYSNGFEEFAIFSAEDAATLDSASIGIADAPAGAIEFTQFVNINEAVGAPSPTILTLAVIPLFILVRIRARAR